MKVIDILNKVCTVLGILLMVYALVGRFVQRPSVLGALVPGGISATAMMIGANTFLLLALLTHTWKKQP